MHLSPSFAPAFDRPKAPNIPFLWTLTVASGALLIVTLLVGQFDARLLEGVPVWAKPQKFALSFAVLFATLALMEGRLSRAWRNSRLLKAVTLIMAVSFVAEMGYMIAQAAQAEPSHFNLSTPFHAFMYQTVMGVGALLLVLGVAVFGVAALLDKDATLDPGLRRGVTWGFVLTCVLTLIVAGTMSNIGRHIGIHPEDGATIPLLGWSGLVGDLRPAHFLSLHAMQALPLAGLYLDRANLGSSGRIMVGLAAVYTLATLALFAQALYGLPLIPLG